MRHLQFVLEGGHNDISIDGIVATLDPTRIVAPLEVKPARPGNVFLVGEDANVPIESSVPAVSWSVTDFWGKVVARGEERTAGGEAVIRPGITRDGYFTLALVAHDGSTMVATRMTGFAVIPPIDVKTLGEWPGGRGSRRSIAGP